MPTLPEFNTARLWPCAPTKRVEVATNALDVVVPVIWTLPDCIERREPGVVVPIPKRLFVASTVRKFAESRVVEFE